ncbi:putative plant self-incompatibility S1 [Helianthus annuus]|uniref:S-protein homolog n=1 Tax=Helianthus annuus TaxID=4232 RepID=A0A9K3NKK1_HELAN|nr:putative plant self-incompatibility S1 [Helianthus annuus]KAJ0561550.1 putative plant self-incompatibility S1 [Helianthus annuus]KAJ0574615.1 putative plant self-incompatibility S1 [Helianthus annuus]KAJ0738946.1 putative plant self-incompatibility S1 [Helianthus annuus]KAJ0781350.1 putative plant self-incompatibility S1 [Helianthus annuus]
MAKKISNFLVVLTCLTNFLITPSYTCWTPFRWSILITNGIPNSTISVHVQSKDDDLGFHNITYNNGYSMFFCENLIHTTLFWGDFSYGQKSASFHVFDVKVSDFVSGRAFKLNHVYWLFKDDGYYLSKRFKAFNDPAWVKQGKW